MHVRNKILFIILFPLLTSGILSCQNSTVQDEEKKGYILPDSLLKTIEIDSVSSSHVVISLTLAGKVDFNEPNVIKLFPTISGQLSDISVMPGDYVKQGQVLGVIRSSDMAGFSNDYITHNRAWR